MKTKFVFMGVEVNIASRNRRRWLVVGIFAGFAAMVIAWFALQGPSVLGWVVFVAFAAQSRFLGGGGYTDGLVPPFEGGDERERNRRFRAHYVAYQYLDFVFLPALIAVMWRANPRNMARLSELRGFFDQLPVALLVAGWILYYTLQQAILLWTEPDLEEQA
ncbi:MAG: hypothetical protein ABR976_22280 [Terracidiphilus sp.]|jgi:hypothetical protein